MNEKMVFFFFQDMFCSLWGWGDMRAVILKYVSIQNKFIRVSFCCLTLDWSFTEEQWS